jgi:hypothetical protein
MAQAVPFRTRQAALTAMPAVSRAAPVRQPRQGGSGTNLAYASSHDARIHASPSSSVVRMTGIAFGSASAMKDELVFLRWHDALPGLGLPTTIRG